MGKRTQTSEIPAAVTSTWRPQHVPLSSGYRRAWVFAPLAFLLVFAVPARAEKSKDLRPQGYVNDFANVLSAHAREQLMALCQEVDQKAQAQIAVVTIHTLEGVPIEDFSIDLATRWGIGPKQKDRGVLILLAVNDHQYRVEVGYGLEGILPDGKVGGFGREMVPALRRQDYDGALLLITGRIGQVIAQDRGVTIATSVPQPPASEPEPSRAFNFGPVILLIVILVLLLRFLFSLSRSGGRRRRGGWWIGGPWVGGGWGGGSWGGGSWSGGGGFGGFGGGSFGGGGASGKW
jgi:uncharacterized protein